MNKMDFSVSTLTGRSLTIETHQDATVSDLQNEIAKEGGLPVPCQQLMVKERMLLSGEKLENIAMKHGHTLYLLSNVRAGMEVRITCLNGDYFDITIDKATTVLQLKMLIEEKRAIDFKTQRLVIVIGKKETEMIDKKEVKSCLPAKQVEYTIYLLMKGYPGGRRHAEEQTLEPLEMDQDDHGSFWKCMCCFI